MGRSFIPIRDEMAKIISEPYNSKTMGYQDFEAIMAFDK